ncbi:MaoC family dehydratase N-terminal domain-containing protein [Kocuria massiliensis]|uniref:MaoC family dehydratase N-terminal domain-containing protein n=1 Tax=Kocuria massiliensis TaxID=1926282 RepID=UPI0022B95147|nr:MaoC family dehydratase N-terminal domain-containing protein [Kocuria massiliensis]
MSENKGIAEDLQGREYTGAPVYSVSREKIREFARAVKAQSPAHVDVEAAMALGHADLVAPPTFAIIVSQAADAELIQDPTAGIDFSRVVHADQRFTHHRPIVAGDELTTTVHVDSVRLMGSGAMVTTREEIVDHQGEPVVTAVSSLLVRGEE